MAVHDDIFAWAQKRPRWQQDALRRLAEAKELTEEDLDELVLLCRVEAGLPLPPDRELVAVPLTTPRLDLGDETARDAVALLRLDGIAAVNALAEDQPIEFAASGLTVIHGDNGTGKTGFGRLLRTLCWARKRPKEILRNAYTNDEQQPRATVHYQIGRDLRQAAWVQGDEPPAELRRISVFDSECASVYINETQQATYVPFGLDLMARLARVSDSIRARLMGELAELQNAAPVWPEDLEETAVGTALQQLPSKQAIDELDAVQPLTDAETLRLDELTAIQEQWKKDDPLREAKVIRARANRIREIDDRVRAVRDGLSNQAVDDLRLAVEDARAKAEAARTASKVLAGKELLPETGDAVWKELWEAARRYSLEAYPGLGYPNTAVGARCVLCQQELADGVGTRLRSFEAFVTNEIAEQTRLSSGILVQRRDSVRALDCAWKDLETVKAEMALVADGLGGSLAMFLESAGRRRTWLLAATHESNWSEAPPLEGPLPDLSDSVRTLDQRGGPPDSSVDPEQRAAQEQEWRGLRARAWATANGTVVASEVNRLEKIAVLRKLTTTETDTVGITSAGNRLTEKHVTGALKDRFQAELRNLHLTHLDVVFEQKQGTKGVTAHHLTLRRGRERRVSEILSAGERNCVALAAFFAELDPDGADAIIFDDPVSSLDQDKRDDVALRLVQESTRRQVIVWTHDLTFLGGLHEWTERLKHPRPKVLTISVLNGRSGIVDIDLPWPTLKVKDRLKKLRNDLDELKRLSRVADVRDYTLNAEAFYRHLRDTWERAVEEILFGDVVQRWRKSVQTSRLAEVADNVTREDFEAITEGMSRCSNYVHDPTTSAPPSVPRVSDAEEDLGKLEGWVIKKRKPTSIASPGSR